MAVPSHPSQRGWVKADKISACHGMRAAVPGAKGIPAGFAIGMGAALRGKHKHEGQARLR